MKKELLNKVIYQVYVRNFTKAGTIKALIKKLDYILEEFDKIEDFLNRDDNYLKAKERYLEFDQKLIKIAKADEVVLSRKQEFVEKKHT